MQLFVGLFGSFYNAICVILHCYMRHFALLYASFCIIIGINFGSEITCFKT